jgi:hypothetical protein
MQKDGLVGSPAHRRLSDLRRPSMTEEESVEAESAERTPRKFRRISGDGPISLADGPLDVFVSPAQVGFLA